MVATPIPNRTRHGGSFRIPIASAVSLNQSDSFPVPNNSEQWQAPSAALPDVRQMATGKEILIVEDEPYLCDLVADVLESEGHHARKASNGLDALTLIAEGHPQLILLDLMMPVMDGWEFMAALRSNPAWQDIPVVIITAVYDVARTQRETGARAVITKPFDIDQLADMVRLFAA